MRMRASSSKLRGRKWAFGNKYIVMCGLGRCGEADAGGKGSGPHMFSWTVNVENLTPTAFEPHCKANADGWVGRGSA